MNKLLNRLAWVISLNTWFVITFLLLIMTNELSYWEFFNDELFFVWIILIVLFASIFKKIFLSKKTVYSLVGLYRMKDEVHVVWNENISANVESEWQKLRWVENENISSKNITQWSDVKSDKKSNVTLSLSKGIKEESLSIPIVEKIDNWPWFLKRFFCYYQWIDCPKILIPNF